MVFIIEDMYRCPLRDSKIVFLTEYKEDFYSFLSQEIQSLLWTKYLYKITISSHSLGDCGSSKLYLSVCVSYHSLRSFYHVSAHDRLLLWTSSQHSLYLFHHVNTCVTRSSTTCSKESILTLHTQSRLNNGKWKVRKSVRNKL